MKKVYKCLLALAVFAVTLSSCKEDDDVLAKKMTIDGESIKLSQGFIQGLGAEFDNNGDLVSVYAAVLTTSGLSVQDGEPVGEGSAVFMQLVSPTSLQLASGTYEITDGGSFVKNLAMSFALKNYNATTDEAEEGYDAVSGTIKISKSGSTYKITFNMVMTDGVNEVDVTGSYEGKLTEEVIYGSEPI